MNFKGTGIKAVNIFIPNKASLFDCDVCSVSKIEICQTLEDSSVLYVNEA